MLNKPVTKQHLIILCLYIFLWEGKRPLIHKLKISIKKYENVDKLLAYKKTSINKIKLSLVKFFFKIAIRVKKIKPLNTLVTLVWVVIKKNIEKKQNFLLSLWYIFCLLGIKMFTKRIFFYFITKIPHQN